MNFKTWCKSLFFAALVAVLILVSFVSCKIKLSDSSTNTKSDSQEDLVKIILVPKDLDVEPDDNQMVRAREIIETRLVNYNVTDYKVSTDNHQIIVTFQSRNDADLIADKLTARGIVTFCAGTTNETVILQGAQDIESAQAVYDQETNKPMVYIKFTNEGKTKFANATQQYYGQTISIWMDDEIISSPTVNHVITNGEATISSSDMTANDAAQIANQINSGSLPFDICIDYDNSKFILK